MSHIFYFFGLFAILFEAVVITKPFRYHEFVKNFEFRKSENPDEIKIIFFFSMVGYLIWVLAGLMSDQWIGFAALLFISMIPLRKLGGFGRLLDALMSFVIVSFLVLNHFHFNINTTDLFLSIFK